MALATMTCPLFGKKHGKTMGKYGNTHRKRWEIHGNPWTQWKFLSWENHGTKGWIFQDGIFQPRLPDMAFHAAEIVGFDCSQHVQWKSTGEHSERYWEGMGKSWDVRNHAGKTLWKLTEIVENGFKTRKTLDFFIETFWTIQVGMKKSQQNAASNIWTFTKKCKFGAPILVKPGLDPWWTHKMEGSFSC